MRHVLAFCGVWLAGAASVSAQVSERLEIGNNYDEGIVGARVVWKF